MSIKELFESYNSAFDNFDARKITQLYTIPCSTVDGDGVNIFQQKSELELKFQKNCLKMKDMGYRKAEFTLEKETPLGTSAKAVTIEWQVQTELLTIHFKTLYICHQQNGQWYIFSAHVYEA